jgi:hypothetical protein
LFSSSSAVLSSEEEEEETLSFLFPFVQSDFDVVVCDAQNPHHHLEDDVINDD